MKETPYTLKYYRRNLPHWLVADHSYFVTLRLKGTLPSEVAVEMQAEREQFQAEQQDKEGAQKLHREQFLKVERILDSLCSENKWLDAPSVAEMVLASLEWLRNRGWKIYAAVLMSNHMHLLMIKEKGSSAELLHDLGQFKRHTAREANRLLGRAGAFWEREDFDHWIRTREKFEGTVRYIANNPVKAGRVQNWKDWKWTYVDESVLYCLE
jgi:putative transposase